MAVRLVDDGGDDGHVYVLNAAGRLVLAEHGAGQLMAATRLPAAYVARELQARAWSLQPHGQGLCQVIAWHPAVVRGDPGWWEACQGSTAHEEPAVCAKHWAALRTPYAWANGHR